MLTSSDLKDPSNILRKKGFELGAVVYEKSQGVKKGAYKILSVSDEGVSMIEQVCFGVPDLTVTVPLAAFFKGWTTFKGELPTEAPSSKVSKSCASDAMQLEEAKCQAFQALYAFEKGEEGNRKLTYAFHPSVVVCTEKCAANTLKLAPLVDLAKLKSEPNKTAPQVKVDQRTLYVSSMPKPHNVEKITNSTLFVPYFFGIFSLSCQGPTSFFGTQASMQEVLGEAH